MIRALALVVTGLLLLGGASTTNEPAQANSNTMSGIGRAGVITVGAATAETLKPPICASLTLTSIRTGSGVVFGSTGADLVLGSAAADAIFALAGNDCVLGGTGGDFISGGAAGERVCDGGQDADTFTGCETTYN
jgi:Ca2+-binding RTX toxin-like protein